MTRRNVVCLVSCMSRLVAVDFDKLGLTDNENPYGVLPPVLARSMGRMSGILLADYIGQVLKRRRISRAEPPPPQPPFANFHGGERYDLLFHISIFICSGETLPSTHSSNSRTALLYELKSYTSLRNRRCNQQSVPKRRLTNTARWLISPPKTQNYPPPPHTHKDQNNQLHICLPRVYECLTSPALQIR